MSEPLFITAEEAAKEMCISKGHAYKILQQLNDELRKKGFITIAGKVNRKYFMERLCYEPKNN